GDEREETERRDIVRIGDRERVDRRQKEEIISKRGGDTGEKRRPQAEADGDGDNGSEKNEVAFGVADPGADQFAKPERHYDRGQCGAIGARIEGCVVLGGAGRLLRYRLAGNGIAGDDVHADIAGTANEIV